jgi:hypothetical protein
MRRLMSIIAFALFLAVPVWAQRGGGGHGGFGGGHAGGFSGHPGGFGGRAGFSGGHIGGGHFSSGMRSASGFSRGPTRSAHTGFSRGPFLHDGFHGHNGFRNRDFRFRDRGFRHDCFGFGCRGFGFPWIYGGYYDPFWWGDSGSSYDEDYERDRAIANEMNEQSLEEQRMRQQEEEDRDRDRYARSVPSPRSGPGDEQQASATQPATVLIFRDQRKKEVQNYAIVGQTLWSFAPQHAEKIPLSELDLTATVKANEDRGITFEIPSSREAQ